MSRVYTALSKGDVELLRQAGIANPGARMSERCQNVEAELRRMRERFAFAAIVAGIEGATLIALAIWWGLS